MAALLGGAHVRLQGDCAAQATWLKSAELPFSDTGDICLTVSQQPAEIQGLHLNYCPQNLVLGIGCERGVDVSELRELLQRANVDNHAISCIASIDVKADERAIHQLAEELDVPVRLYPAETLELETPRLVNPSKLVFQEVGCHGVAEGAALAAVGAQGELLLAKQKSKRATLAVGRSPKPVNVDMIGRPRGHLSVVGIGPGSAEWRSPEVTNMVGAATDLVGYSLYLDLLGDLTQGKTRHDFDLGKEEDRVRHAMELAGQGRNVALVCSGDAGIYAMATLVFELLNSGGLSDGAQRIAAKARTGTVRRVVTSDGATTIW